MPQKFSQLGPFLTIADINNDGREDFFVGGGGIFSGEIFTQQKGQTFSSKKITDSIKMEEDMDCVLFDADKDGDMDLLVTGGDVRYEADAEFYKPRFYLNDGKVILPFKEMQYRLQ
ncbi:MAG: VCBS repeat-containing protein [Chitinophagaceae bacterium]